MLGRRIWASAAASRPARCCRTSATANRIDDGRRYPRVVANSSATEPHWQGAALLRPGVLAFTGSIGATERHAHHAVQIITATTAVTVRDDAGTPHRGTTVIVPADAGHRVETGAQQGSVVFLEPESARGRAVHMRGAGSGWAEAAVGHVRLRSPATVVADLLEWLAPAPGAVTPPEHHPAVVEALRQLPELIVAGPVGAGVLASRAGISVSRLTHLFTAQVGIPLRRYVLWSRLRIAISRVRAGDDLTAAAHGAGFADSAHLTRTTRTMFGLAPSVLSRHVSWDVEPDE